MNSPINVGNDRKLRPLQVMRQRFDHGLIQFYKNALGQRKVGTCCFNSCSDEVDQGFDVCQQRAWRPLIHPGLPKHCKVLRRKIGLE
jgi:hypothetical protein